LKQSLARQTEADYFDDMDEAFTLTGGKLNKKSSNKSAMNSQLEHLALDKAGNQVGYLCVATKLAY
jgi:hypothetical protein